MPHPKRKPTLAKRVLDMLVLPEDDDGAFIDHLDRDESDYEDNIQNTYSTRSRYPNPFILSGCCESF